MPPKKVYCEHGALSKELKALQSSGVIELIHFPYDSASRTKHISPTAKPSKAQWDDANLAWSETQDLKWSDFQGSPMLTQILNIVGRANRRDAFHVDSAFKSQCFCFVTNDEGDILQRAGELRKLLGFPFFHSADAAKSIVALLDDARIKVTHFDGNLPSSE